MDNLWFRTNRGFSKDWDDEFDYTDNTITYEFPYSELASQSNKSVPTVVTLKKMPTVASPILNQSESVSSKKPTIVDEVKDGNILKSRRTYSKKRKNPLFIYNEMSQAQDQKQKEFDSSPEIQRAKHPRIEQQQKSPGKYLRKETNNQSMINENVQKAEECVPFNNFPKAERVNGLKDKSVSNDYFNPQRNCNQNSEYSLFGDVTESLNVDQCEKNTDYDSKEHDLTSKNILSSGYQRTRKNLRKEMDNKMLQLEQSILGRNNVASSTNNCLPVPIKNTFNSRLALEDVMDKKQKQDSEDSNLSVSSSNGEDVILDFRPPPPRKQLSLMDMVRKYSEIQKSPLNKNNTSKRKKGPTKKAVQAKPQNTKTAKNTSSKRAIINKSDCNNLVKTGFNVGAVNGDYSQNEKSTPGLFIHSSPTSKKNRKKRTVADNNHKVNSIPKIPVVSLNVNQTDKNSNQSQKQEKAPPKKRQTRTRKPKCVPCCETDGKLDIPLSSNNNKQSSAQSVLNSPVSKRGRKKASARPMNKTEDKLDVSVPTEITLKNRIAADFLPRLPSNAAISQNGQTAAGNQLLPQNIQMHVPASIPLCTSISNSKLPMAPVFNANVISNTEKVNISIQNVSEPFQLDPSASVYSDQLNLSDSESDSSVVNHRTFSLLGADFFCHMFSKMNSISKSCVVECLEDAEDWIAKTPYSRELTVKEFCNNPFVMNVLLEFLSGCPDFEKLSELIHGAKVSYEFPEDFQTVPLFRMLKDYVDQILLQMVPPNFSPVLSLSSQSVLKFAFENMPLRECAIMSLLFSKRTELLKLADVAAKLNFVAMLVIFDEFRQREIES